MNNLSSGHWRFFKIIIHPSLGILVTSPEHFHFWNASGNARDKRLTSQLGGHETFPRGFNLYFRIASFRVFASSFLRVFVTQRRRKHWRSLVLEIVENGGIMFVQVRFYFRSIYQLCLLSGSIDHLQSSISLVKNFHRS